MNNIKFSDFENICRTCMSTSDLIFITGYSMIIDVFQFLSGTIYSKTDELPQQLCAKCIKTMNDIQTFAFQCKQTNLTLTNCLINFKNNQPLLENKIEQNQVEFVAIKQEVIDDINNDELNAEENQGLQTENFVKDEIIFQQMMTKSEIKNEESTIPETNELNTDTNINYYSQETNLVKDKETNDDRPYKCDTCNKGFKCASHLTRHKRIHSGERPYQCEVCNKTFTTNSNLVTHKIIHTDERPHECEVCYKRFTTKSILLTHKVTHTDKCQFECNICLKKFKHTDYLSRHKKIHSGERPFQCDVCNKTFTAKSYLVAHKVTHSDERRFECDVCTKGFKHLANLIHHKRIHSGERPYQCEVCDQTFKTNSHLRQHKDVHSDDRSFECDVCLKYFKYSRQLIEHKKIHSVERLYDV